MNRHPISASQLRHAVQLCEESGSGLGESFQAWIRQVTSGGLAVQTDDPRQAQAKRLWDLGVAGILSGAPYRKFREYLDSIPEVPEALREEDGRFPLLALVETRVRLASMCNMADVNLSASLDTPASETPYWIRAHDGHRNSGTSPELLELAEFEQPLSRHELLALVIQHRPVFVGRSGHSTVLISDPAKTCEALLVIYKAGEVNLHSWDAHRYRVFDPGSPRRSGPPEPRKFTSHYGIATRLK